MISIASQVQIVSEAWSDAPAREALLDVTLGPARHQKCSQRLRDFCQPAEGLAFSVMKGEELVGTVRLWNVLAGPHHRAPRCFRAAAGAHPGGL